jgi:hypothetical protein
MAFVKVTGWIFQRLKTARRRANRTPEAAEVEVVDRVLGWCRQIVPSDQRLRAAQAERRIGMVIEQRVRGMVQNQWMHAVAVVAVGAQPRWR